MDKEKGLFNGKFSFKVLPDGSLNKNKVICIYYRCELSYNRSTLSLKYHSLAKHIAEAESLLPPHHMQTMVESLQRRSLDNSTYNKQQEML